MLYTLAEAAKASGLGASAIRTAIERGQIAAIRDLFDEWQVEDSELYRLHLPVGRGNARRNDGASPSAASPVAPERQIPAQPEDAGRLAQDGPAGAAAESTEPGCARAKQAAAPDRAGAASCSGAGAEGDGTDVERAPAGLQHCLSSLQEQSEADRHGNDDAIFRLSVLDPVDRIAIGNASLCETELKIDACPDPRHSAMRPPANRGRSIVFAAALLTVFVIGWVGGLGTYYLLSRSMTSPSDEHGSYSAASSPSQIAAAETGRHDSGSGATVTGKITPLGAAENRARRRFSSPGTPQASEPRTGKFAQIARQNPAEAASDHPSEPQATNGVVRRQPVPETKPTTVEGWTVRSVYNGTAVLEGPGGVWTAARGDSVPGLGRVDSIVLWGSRWIVATTRGLVTTP